MAARVLLGNSTNSNLGHSGGKFGLYVSANGKDVTNCAKNELKYHSSKKSTFSKNMEISA